MISALPPGNVEENINMGTAIISNLDSVREPRVLAIDFDSQYGNYSGGQMIAAVKIGTTGFATALNSVALRSSTLAISFRRAERDLARTRSKACRAAWPSAKW